MNMGIEEHEQKGVTVPSKADMIFTPNPSKRPRIFFTSFRWKIALYIRNDKNQHAK